MGWLDKLDCVVLKDSLTQYAAEGGEERRQGESPLIDERGLVGLGFGVFEAEVGGGNAA